MPLRGKCTFLTNFECFPRKGTLFTLFYYFSDFKSVKKVYSYEENALFSTNFECFPRKGTFFLLF